MQTAALAQWSQVNAGKCKRAREANRKMMSESERRGVRLDFARRFYRNKDMWGKPPVGHRTEKSTHHMLEPWCKLSLLQREGSSLGDGEASFVAAACSTPRPNQGQIFRQVSAKQQSAQIFNHSAQSHT